MPKCLFSKNPLTLQTIQLVCPCWPAPTSLANLLRPQSKVMKHACSKRKAQRWSLCVLNRLHLWLDKDTSHDFLQRKQGWDKAACRQWESSSICSKCRQTNQIFSRREAHLDCMRWWQFVCLQHRWHPEPGKVLAEAQRPFLSYWSVNHRRRMWSLWIPLNWATMWLMYDPTLKHTATLQQCYTQTSSALWLISPLEIQNAPSPWAMSQPSAGRSRESKLSAVRATADWSISTLQAQQRTAWPYQKRWAPATAMK